MSGSPSRPAAPSPSERFLPGLQGPLRIEQYFDAARSRTPLVLLLHGALRYSGDLASWASACAEYLDFAAANLPGHGGSFVPTGVSLAHMSAEIAALIQGAYAHRTVFIVGESLGGLIGLALATQPPSNLAGVVAADPFLSTLKLKDTAAGLQQTIRDYPANAFVAQMALEIFGVPPEGSAISDLRYVEYLARLARPALVLTGEIPAVGLGATIMPPLLDADDRKLIRGLTAEHLSLREIPGVGHTLLSENPAATLAHVRRFIATQTQPPPSTADFP